MADTLCTFFPDGTITRAPWRQSESESMEAAFDRLQNGRRPKLAPDHGQGCRSAVMERACNGYSRSQP